jgi:hypothetical protein
MSIISAGSISLDSTFKVNYRRPRMRQKYFIVFEDYANMQSLSAHGDNDDFTVVLFRRSHLQIRQKYFSVHGK